MARLLTFFEAIADCIKYTRPFPESLPEYRMSDTFSAGRVQDSIHIDAMISYLFARLTRQFRRHQSLAGARGQRAAVRGPLDPGDGQAGLPAQPAGLRVLPRHGRDQEDAEAVDLQRGRLRAGRHVREMGRGPDQGQEREGHEGEGPDDRDGPRHRRRLPELHRRLA